MSRDSTDDSIDYLIALGVIAVIGYGIFRVLRSFAGHEAGDTVRLSNDQDENQNVAYCECCDEMTERFDRSHCNKRHCKRCHAARYYGYKGCWSCGNCLFCNEGGGNECYACAD